MRRKAGSNTAANTCRIFGFAGSLRKGSYNKALLRSAGGELLPNNVELEIFHLEDISSFNTDLEQQPQAKVTEFKTKMKTTDVLDRIAGI